MIYQQIYQQIVTNISEYTETITKQVITNVTNQINTVAETIIYDHSTQFLKTVEEMMQNGTQMDTSKQKNESTSVTDR